MQNIAIIIWQLSGKSADAIHLIRDCLAKEEQALGYSHPRAMGNSEMLREWEAEKVEREIEWESEDESEEETEEDD